MQVTAATPRSLTIALAIAAAWLTIHIGAIFWWHFTPALLLLIPVQAWLSTGLFIVAHDAMHGSLAPGRPAANLWAGRIALGLYAALDFDRLRGAHFMHHRHAGTADDPDFSARHPRAFVPWLAGFVGQYYTHMQIVRVTLIALAYMALGAPLWRIVVFWAVPALTAMLQLFYFGTYLPHRHRDDAFADRHRARSNAMGPWAAVTTCFNFGAFHHEHHLFPDTPWWALPQRRERGRASAG